MNYRFSVRPGILGRAHRRVSTDVGAPPQRVVLEFESREAFFPTTCWCDMKGEAEMVTKTRPTRCFLQSAIIVCLLALAACAVPESPPPDVAALADEHGLSQKALSDYLEGYGAGYDDGTYRSMGVSAGSGLGNVPGWEGIGWELGFQDSMGGRPMRDPEELAGRLAERAGR